MLQKVALFNVEYWQLCTLMIKMSKKRYHNETNSAKLLKSRKTHSSMVLSTYLL